MNKRRLAGIARWLEGGAKHKKYVEAFNMAKGLEFNERKDTAEETLSCGTTCCIAGAAVQFYNKPVELIDATFKRNFSLNWVPWFMVSTEATKLLGLDELKADALFHARGIPECYHKDISPAWAARVIRKLIATGTVDWEGCRDETA